MTNVRPVSPSAICNVLTSESVTEGHPDKVADLIADSILDAHLAQDPLARVACEVLVKDARVVLAGEITSSAQVDHDAIVRQAIAAIGYTDPDESFNASTVRILDLLGQQAAEISAGVNGRSDPEGHQGAGDQGIMFGYASNETEELLPLPAVLAHRLTQALAQARHSGAAPWLRPDAKSQVSVIHDRERPESVTAVVVSTQHDAATPLRTVEGFVRDAIIPCALDEWHNPRIRVLVNPAGTFTQGGPSADCGVTGRKVMVDSYGGLARHGGGAFSGKDPSKVDRSAAYFARFVARQVVSEGLAERCEIQVAYAIGRSTPVGLSVDTFGTGPWRAALEYTRRFDWTPAGIIAELSLRRPIFSATTNYGHFGRAGFAWET
jgi:S-adenosylmethionine synthetase